MGARHLASMSALRRRKRAKILGNYLALRILTSFLRRTWVGLGVVRCGARALSALYGAALERCGRVPTINAANLGPNSLIFE